MKKRNEVRGIRWRGGMEGIRKDEPQPPIAISSSSLYFPPNVKSMVSAFNGEWVKERERGGG